MCDNMIIDSIGHELKAINHLMQRKMLSSATAAGIDKVTIMHGWIISYLYDNQHTNVFQKDIESVFSISRSTVTNILKLMEKKEYIKRVSVDSDARLKKIILTDKGKEINVLLKQAIIDNENRFNSILTQDEKDTFLSLIRKLRSGLENT